MSFLPKRFHLGIVAILAAVLALTAVNVFPRMWSPEHRLSDWMVTFLSPTHSVNPDIVLVTVRDDLRHRQNLTSLLPTDRLHLAKLNSCLSEGGSSVIGYDMLFDWPDSEGNSILEDSMRFASKTTPIVIGTVLDTIDAPTPQVDTKEIDRFASSTKAKLGIIELINSGSSGSVRYATGDGYSKTHPMFSTLIATLSGKTIRNEKPFLNERFRIAWTHGGDRLDGKAVRFTDFASLDIVELCESSGGAGLKPLVDGKIVLVGSRAQRDHHKIPLSTTAEYSNGMIGLEIHATIIAQILNGPHINEPGRFWNFLIAILAAAVGLVIHNVQSLRTYKKFVIVGVAYSATMIVWFAFAIINLLLPLSLILIAITNGAFAQQAGSGLYGLGKRGFGVVQKRFAGENSIEQ